MRIDFVIGDLPPEGGSPRERRVVPVVDGVPLSRLVARFEQEHEMEPAGGYAGIVPAFYNFGALDRYFVGDPHPAFSPNDGKIALLTCECGEVGCWPLHALVGVHGDVVEWSDFEQPHRANRDYSAFGPFVFDASQYRRAVERLMAVLVD